MSGFAEKLRSVTGTGTAAERYASFVRTLIIVTKEADSLADALTEATAAERYDYSIDKACSDASAEMCKGLVIPELTPEQASGSFAAMQRYANQCQAKSKYVLTLYAPTK